MILVDTSVWINHLRSGVAEMATLLAERRVLGHRHVVGEIALGTWRQRTAILDGLDELPQTTIAAVAEVRWQIEHHALMGYGIGYVDAHLLASARLMPGVALWTLDRRLTLAAERLGVAAAER